MTQRMPTLYIPHGGGPCFFMDWQPADTWTAMGDYLKGIAATLPERPRAILLVSAHWAASRFTVGAAAEPALIYDYYGFPQHTYELTYPAPGDPALARRVADMLAAAGVATALDAARGHDHGVFIPLKLVFPDADVPIVLLSLRADYDPAAHLAAGRALAPLRDEGVLIVGSGMSFHNMAAFRDPAFASRIGDAADAFDAWLTDTLTAADAAARTEALTRWERAPAARLAHPPHGEEHLMPLLIAAGAAAGDAGTRDFTDPRLHVSGFRFG